MYHKTVLFLLVSLNISIFYSAPVSAQSQETTAPSCNIENRICLLQDLTQTAKDIDNKSWRDQTYREIAKTYAKENKINEALTFIEKIETPDTKAMTIRGIGMEAAKLSLTKEELDYIFKSLRTEAEKITHPPSYAIALTYIAMAQAFAKDNQGAWNTAADMENDALRHKAYGETAEIQAENGDFKSAKISIQKIESSAYRNKAYSTVSNILSDKGQYQDAYNAAQAITNAYKKSQAIQYLLDMQDKEDKEKEKGGTP